MQDKKCKLVIFSDIHYAPEPPVNNGSIIERKLTQYSIPLIKQLIGKINNSIQPDVAINLGDLIEDFNDHDKDVECFGFIWNVLKEIKVPFYSAIGNHDLRSLKSDEDIKKITGYDDFTFAVDIKGYHLVFLGLTINHNIGNSEGGIHKTRVVSNKDLEWLRNDLENNNLPVLIFTHFGIAEDDMKGNWWFEEAKEDALIQNRKEIKEILEKDNNLIAVFSGHQHWTKTTIENNIPYHVIGSLTEDIKSDGVPDGIYFEVDLEKNKLKITEHHLKLNEEENN
jgi:Predicted phosphohydrolases